MSYETICNEISRIRKVRGIGLRQMADEIGISAATLCRIENHQSVSTDVAAKIGPWAGECACCGQKMGEQP